MKYESVDGGDYFVHLTVLRTKFLIHIGFYLRPEGIYLEAIGLGYNGHSGLSEKLNVLLFLLPGKICRPQRRLFSRFPHLGLLLGAETLPYCFVHDDTFRSHYVPGQHHMALHVLEVVGIDGIGGDSPDRRLFRLPGL